MSEQPRASGLDFTDIAVDRDAEIPLGIQLAWALRTRIGDGTLNAGQRLPGLRELADTIGLNVNTVRTVYQRLQQDGLIESQQGSGTFVTGTLKRKSAAATIAADAAREARETGVDPREVAAALYVSPASAGQPTNDAAEERRVLRQQIAALEQTLGAFEAKHPGVAPPPTAGTSIGPALLDAAELERIQAQLVRRLAVVQAAIDGLVSEQDTNQGKGHEGEPAPSRSPAARGRATTRPAPAGA